ncbi:MAG TPA: hypothetical protein VG672_16275 [Bryobacteraceae bacterium]|jgi:hypothetical protein|nr:hypothetical protein [Bryobacteraceae bacterium]
MTKVQMRFSLQKPLDEQDFERLERVHSKYGILKIQLDPSLSGLSVEYDATRLRPTEVEAALACQGIPIQPVS